MIKHNSVFKRSLAIIGLAAFANFVQAQERPPLPVAVQTIEQSNVGLTYDYPARVQSPNEVEVHARVSGILQSMHYQEGSKVEAGDLLFTIDPEPYEIRLEIAQANVKTAEAQMRQAEREKRRVDGLYKEKAVSAQERDRALSDYELAQAGLLGAKASLKDARLNLKYTKVTAPISGFVDVKNLDIGDLVGREYGPTKLTTITKLDPINIVFSIGEKEFVEREQQVHNNILRYTQGDKPKVKVTHLGKTLEGSLDFIGHKIDQTTGSVNLKATFPNETNILLPGAFVRIELSGIEAVDVIEIPQKAVLQVGAQSFVYLVKEGKAQMIPVNLQRAVGLNWLIDEGLNPGDQIILNNLVKVRPGMPVQALASEDNSEAN